MSDIVTALLTAQSRSEEVRAGFENAMQSAFNWVNPRRCDMTGAATKGAIRKTKMYDGVAQDAFLTWVEGIIGWFVGQSLTWQRAAIGSIPGILWEQARQIRQDDVVQSYLQDYTEQMRFEFNSSTFYDIENEWLQDLGSAGTGVVITEESQDMTHSVLRVPHPGRYWIDWNADYKIDAYHEKVTMTARQCWQKYRKTGDTLHPTVAKWAQDANSAGWEVTLLQCIRPSNDPIFERRTSWSPYSLVTLLYDLRSGSGTPTLETELKDSSKRLIRIQPLSRFTPTVCRLRTNSDELYGYSQAMDIMSVIEAVQQHGYNLLNMGNHAADPMWAVPEEKRLKFSKMPGSRFGYGDAKRIPIPLYQGGEYPIAVDREDKLQALIRARYGYQLWNMMPMFQAKKERVQATEISEARVDQARLLSGQTGNIWKQGITPMYDAVAGIAREAGRLPAPPAILQDLAGQNIIAVRPIGMLAQLQEFAANVSGLQQGLRFLSEIAEITGRHISPRMAAQLYHRINLPDLAEYVLDTTSFPQRLMRSDEDVAARIAQDEQMERAAAQAQNAQRIAAAAAQLGKPVDESSLMAGAVG